MPPLEFTTPAFADGGSIPKRFTRDGADASPPLSIANVPDDAGSLAIVVDDPDGPSDPFVHWLIWNLPGDLDDVPADIAPERKLDDLSSAFQGTNGFGDVGYRGPCPPKTTTNIRIDSFYTHSESRSVLMVGPHGQS